MSIASRGKYWQQKVPTAKSLEKRNQVLSLRLNQYRKRKKPLKKGL